MRDNTCSLVSLEALRVALSHCQTAYWMTAGAPRLHSPDSRISWRLNPLGMRMGLDQFIVCQLGSSDHSGQQLILCASWVNCKHDMKCHKPGLTLQRLILRQEHRCVELHHPINGGQEPLNGWRLPVGNFQSLKVF